MSFKSNNRKIQPTVVIGLGGTGMNAIINLKRRVTEEFGHPLDQICPYLRFLLIDTEDPKETLFPEHNIDIADFNLKPEEILIISAEDISEKTVRNEPSVQEWFPKEQILYSNVNKLKMGTYAVKPLGRLVFFFNYSKIKEKIRELFSIPIEFGDHIVERPLSVYVVASLAGGTGAGMFLDLGFLLKNLLEEGDIPYDIEVRGLFALGEIYAAKAGDRAIANTYESLKELNYYMRSDTSFHSIYKDIISYKTINKPYDLIYLFGFSNQYVNIEEASQLPEMFSEFIFINSSTLVAEHIWRYRVNKSHYTSLLDDRDIPFCYSSMGLTIIRFPRQQILELAAAKFAQKIIMHFFLRPQDINKLDIDKVVKAFIQDKSLICDQESQNQPFDLSKKLITMDYEDVQDYLESAIILTFSEYSDSIKSMHPIKQTRSVLNNRMKQLRSCIDEYILQFLSYTKNSIKEEIRSIIKCKKLGGIQPALEFCNKLHEVCCKTNEFAQKELKASHDRSSTLSRKFTNEYRILQSILSKIMLFKRKAKREQLEITLRKMRNLFLNEIYSIRYAAVTRFMEVYLDTDGNLKNEGIIPFLTKEIERLERIKSMMDRINREMEEHYDHQLNISRSIFDQVVFDSNTLAEFHDVYNPIDKNESKVYEVAKKIIQESSKMFEHFDFDSFESDLGLPAIHFHEEEFQSYRSLFLQSCREPFCEELDRYNVEERIFRSLDRGGPDYLDRMNTYYRLSHHYAVLDQKVINLARFREELQTLFIIGIEDKDKSRLPKYFQHKVGLLPGEGTGNFITTRDKHQIVILREVHGFPAYMLKACKAYQNKYSSIKNDVKQVPLHMIQENLKNYEPPQERVFFKYEKKAIEGLILGIIIVASDEYSRKIYMMIDMEQRQIRKKAFEQKNQSKNFKPNASACGIKLDSTFEQTVYDKIHFQTDLETNKKYFEILIKNIDEVKTHIAEHDKYTDDNIIVNLFLAYYHEFPLLGNDPTVNKDDIQKIIKNILLSEYSVDSIERNSSKTYQEILKELNL